MFRKAFYILILIMLTICCKRNIKQEIVAVQEKKLKIKCENERLLIENPSNNLAYSFDTIESTKNYWQHIKYEQEKSIRNRLHPFTSIYTDTPSLYNKLDITLVGYGESRNDERLKLFCFSSINGFDSIRIQSFYKRISEKTDTTEIRSKAEILLFFYQDSIRDIITPLKTITGIYLSFQRENSKKIFKKYLCLLTKEQIDSLKRNVPFRIRLIKNLSAMGNN